MQPALGCAAQVGDALKSKELKIICCPAGGLVAGYNSKPLQGPLLAKHRSAAFGVKEEDFDLYKEMYVANPCTEDKSFTLATCLDSDINLFLAFIFQRKLVLVTNFRIIIGDQF